ncbi:MAG TPA: hypothetical protein VGB43_05985, partial [Flavobacterium sp.]
MHHNNDFIRKFAHNPAEEVSQTNLIYNSYYIAGASANKLYLGNHTTPFEVTILDKSFQKRSTHHIKLDVPKTTFQSTQLRIVESNFFLYDGTVPFLYQGNTADWQAIIKPSPPLTFTLAEPIDSSTVVFRTFHPNTGENIIGSYSISDPTTLKFGSQLLQKQIDGIFDTDGILKINYQLGQFVYLYR